MPCMEDLAKEIQSLKLECNVSTEAICAEASVSMATINRVFRNRRVSANTANHVRRAVKSLRQRYSNRVG
jgi:DNA-binding LacI/PurR family transcriptional regulator